MPKPTLIQRVPIIVVVLAVGTAVAEEPGGTFHEEAGRIVNLYDAFGHGTAGTTQDFGFSAYVEYRGKRILFDAGTNADILRTNAEALGIDLASIDFAVASHSHADHISGFDYLLEVNPEVPIYFPNDFFGGAAPITFNIQGTDPNVVGGLPPELRYFGGGVDQIEIQFEWSVLERECRVRERDDADRGRDHSRRDSVPVSGHVQPVPESGTGRDAVRLRRELHRTSRTLDGPRDARGGGRHRGLLAQHRGGHRPRVCGRNREAGLTRDGGIPLASLHGRGAAWNCGKTQD